MIKPVSRLNALNSGTKFGSLEIDLDHLTDKMEKFMSNLEKENSFDTYYKLTEREQPRLDRPLTKDKQPVRSDIMLGENCRHNKMLEEQFRKNMMNIRDLRKLNDPQTRVFLSASRGYERWLINFLNELDSEALNRRTIKPLTNI